MAHHLFHLKILPHTTKKRTTTTIEPMATTLRDKYKRRIKWHLETFHPRVLLSTAICLLLLLHLPQPPACSYLFSHCMTLWWINILINKMEINRLHCHNIAFLFSYYSREIKCEFPRIHSPTQGGNKTKNILSSTTQYFYFYPLHIGITRRWI